MEGTEIARLRWRLSDLVVPRHRTSGTGRKKRDANRDGYKDKDGYRKRNVNGDRDGNVNEVEDGNGNRDRDESGEEGGERVRDPTKG